MKRLIFILILGLCFNAHAVNLDTLSPTPTGDWNYGGGTVEIPNSADVRTVTVGQIALSGDILEIHTDDGESRGLNIAQPFSGTVFDPDAIFAISKDIALFRVDPRVWPHGISMDSLGIAIEPVGTYEVGFEVWIGNPRTFIASIDVLTTTSNAESIDVSVLEQTISPDTTIYASINDTDINSVNLFGTYFVRDTVD